MTEKDKVEPEIKESLMKLAVGYDYEEKEIIGDKNGDNPPKVKLTKKHVPPDMAAIVMIEKLKRQGRW